MISKIPSSKLKQFLIGMARGAGDIHMHYFHRVHRIQVKRGAGIVTEADKAAEQYLLKNIFRKFPDSSVVTEESGVFTRGKELCWIMDPLDGTSNYAHGFPMFCVSIALYEHGKPRAGVIYQPTTREMFYAEVGKGCFLNGKRLQVSKNSAMPRALLGTGFYYSKGEMLRQEVEIFRTMAEKTLAVRRPGSAALDLACVASGRYDGFWERGLSPWDVAAGYILVEEAGGKISTYDGKPVGIYDKDVIASNGLIHRKMIFLIQRGLKQGRR